MTGKGRALLIATDGYSDGTFRQLRAPRADAEALAAVLADPAVGGYEVETLHNPPAHEANLAIEDLFAAAWLDDLVLLYISGHGVRDDFGQLHLAMTNSRHDRLNATAVSAQFVRNQMDTTRSRRVVVVLDCCFAGAFPPGSTHRAGESVGVLSQLGGRGSAVMTSSSALEYSFESGRSAGSTVVGTASPSVFTGALIEGLRTGGADRNGDGLIDVDELYDFIYEHVEAAGRPQTPGLDSQFQGRLIVAASAVAADLPPEFALALRSPLPAVRLAAVDELSERLTSDGADSAEAVRTALERLAKDDTDSVAIAARAALESTGATSRPGEAAGVRSGFFQEGFVPSSSPAANLPRSATAEQPNSAVHDSINFDGFVPAATRREDSVRSPGFRRKLFISAGIATGIAALVAVFYQGAEYAASQHAGHLSGVPQQRQAGKVRIPPGFVPLPTRQTPSADPVRCDYRPDEGERLAPGSAPASGEVPAKGIVRATINTNVGAMPAILDRSLAPCTVNSFVHLAENGFYDSTHCRGGNVPSLVCGPVQDGLGAGYTWTDKDEFTKKAHLRGYLTMSGSERPDFGVDFEDHQSLFSATIFGAISEEGLEVIDGKRGGSGDPDNDSLSSIMITNVNVEV
ncbi:caspase, EACC1-associated type [Saccharopolyspora gloriosae]|uniref:caspase, EACC1-associated type n=1 Tax=Saccharopolyspora gloriosae TaxID=455344 RepID=UPI001FB70B15|nr:caspase family protein [Saccharopolyspora gloriosae]